MVPAPPATGGTLTRQKRIPALGRIVTLAGDSPGLHMAVRNILCQMAMRPEHRPHRKALSLLHLDLLLALSELCFEQGKSLGATASLIRTVEACFIGARESNYSTYVHIW
jgi:hypothetical protein